MFPVRSALFVDYDNFKGLPNLPIGRSVANWVAWLEDGKFADGRRRRFLRKAAYWHPTNAGQLSEFSLLGFQTRECVYVAGRKAKTSAVDLYLAIDAVALACARKPPHEIIILASDSDYFPIVELLNEKGIRSVVVRAERDASHNYEGVAQHLITEADLAEACTYQRRRPWWARLFARRKPVPTAAIADPEMVADAVARAALATRAPLTMRSLLRVLRDLPGFAKTGPQAFFGFGSMSKLLRAITERRPDLKVWRDNNRGLVIQARPRKREAISG
ncbi:MAG: NYN domain-containing protein [Hyphomonadaceae bacterium]|nr:NYN domain-containing protein [Hyphomonadaceae bacterium]